MKRSLFILFTLLFIGFVAVAQADAGGTLDISENGPSLQVQYERLPSGWSTNNSPENFYKTIAPPKDDNGNLKRDEMTSFQTTDDNDSSMEIDYCQRQDGHIGLSQQLQSEIVSIKLLRAYVQRENEHDYASFKEHEIELDGHTGYEFIKHEFKPTTVHPRRPYILDGTAKIKRYILLNLPNAEPVLIEVSLSADTYKVIATTQDEYSPPFQVVDQGGAAAEWVKQLGSKWDRQVAADIKALGAEVDRILNGLHFVQEGEEAKNNKSKGTVWELISTDVRLYDNPRELGNTNPFGDARITSSGTWSQPPQFLYEGETDSLYFWLEDDSVNVFIDGTKLSSNNIVTNVKIEDLRWKVPGGNPGDQLALTFAVRGPDNDEFAGTVVFYYKLKSYTKTPKVN